MNKLTINIIVIMFALTLSSVNLLSNDYKIMYSYITDSSSKYNYSINIRYPQIQGYIDKKTEEKFNRYIKEFVESHADTFKTEMKNWEFNEEGFSSTYEIIDSIFYSTDEVISILLNGYTYFAGAAHPSTFFYSINYDLKNNKVIKLSSLFEGKYLKAISDYCIKDLQKQAEEYMPDPDITWIKEGAGPKKENYSVFNFTNDMLIVTFPAYQVGSYAEGPKEVAIPFSVLADVIKNDGPLAK